MSIDEFRKHKYLPSQWRKELQTSGILQVVLQVLEDAHPNRFPVHTDIQDDLSPTKAALQLGEARGYSKVLNTLRFLAQPEKRVLDVGQPTYAQEEKQ
jgi:hypothetical protein